MYKIISKRELSSGIFQMEIEAPQIAKKVQSGQFVILRINEEGERIPLTVADYDREKGLIKIIFQAVGLSTKLLGNMKENDYILDFVGPLGKRSEISSGLGTVVCIGGGIGVAPIHPVAKAMKEAGNKVISIIGARSKDILIMEEDIKKVSDEVLVTTDDGSYGIHGFVTDALKQIIDRGDKPAVVYAIGPVVMMRSVAKATKMSGIKTVVSLNPIMIDGTGMCGCCRVTVGDETRFACVDGPEFDGHLVDFEELMMRLTMYREEEAKAKDHSCRIGLGRD